MKTSRFARVALALGVVSACTFGLAACSSQSGSDGAVAATVNGTEIAEQKVTDQIEQIRTQSGLEDADQWGQFLVENDMTPSSVRQQIIDSLTEQELIQQGAKELGITVESSEIDEYVNQMKQNYSDDEAWNKALDQAGFTEDEYRKLIEESLYEQKVGDHFEEEAELTDEDYVTSAQTYASSYDGAKRSSHILFGVGEEEGQYATIEEATAKAQEVLAQINSGALDFAEAAKQYSTDTGSAAEGGDVGWDSLNSFVSEYTDALDGLALNQVSGPVESEYGIHIIKCTDVYSAPEDTSQITSLDQIPEAFQDNIKEMAASVKANTAYEEWLDKLKEDGNIVVNDMPSGLSYDIDLAPYQDANADSDENADADEGSEASAEADSATESESSSSSAAESDAAADSTAASESSSSSAAA